MVVYNYRGSDGMADIADSKSAARKGVRVSQQILIIVQNSIINVLFCTIKEQVLSLLVKVRVLLINTSNPRKLLN